MRKVLSAITCAAVIGWAGSAMALPATWQDQIDWTPDIYSKAGGPNDPFDFFLDIGNDGFVSIFQGGDDFVAGYTLTIALKDDTDRIFKNEIAWIWQPAVDFTSYNFKMDFEEIGGTIGGLIDINHDGTLNVRIDAIVGDFYIDYAKIVACGDDGRGASPVPEPATMLLFGTGLMGLAAAGRRRQQR
ncbi:PEP-CTERM sorting domain-containing protein [Desulfobulbus sp.]|uniref:PEP-CTERM sorting domain-containing protein n=1 Tax=Desulfobulbus sp. TaxID=895 RepID=UPI00286F0E63|nr:PEP-CTERM sorting domain-containing protein [Desulfobulbus sp.]